MSAPALKRQKISAHNDDGLQEILETWLGKGCTATGPPKILQSLLGNNAVKIRQDLYKLQKLFDQVGFRTSIVQSPRLAVSLYKDSCVLSEAVDEEKQNLKQQKDYLLTMLGLHPEQKKLEIYYRTQLREEYCLQRFLDRLRSACPKAMKDPQVQGWIMGNQDSTDNKSHAVSSKASDVPTLMRLMRQADHRLRQEQLDHEMERIHWYHCTLANALLQQFLAGYHCCVIKDVFFKTSHVAKYERLTFYLYDPEIDMVKPASHFVFLPDLSRALQTQQQESFTLESQSTSIQATGGTHAIVQDMMNTFWTHLLRHGGYHTSTKMKEQLSPALERYFLSGLQQDPNTPLKLNAHFEPCEPLSLYLYGKAGSGKSSFVRHVAPAIQAAIETHTDPEMLARFVKQLLNKPYKDLSLELDLRPNNNDLSVMSIIQSRKCTMTQSKPGLVVIALEEMPKFYENLEEHDPNQLQVCQLISQRFGGRKGNYDGDKKAPRNSDKRGIGNDSSLITIFTSNYTLEEPSLSALQRLAMFQHLTVVEMTAIDGDDRKVFAHTYFQQSINDRINPLMPSSSIELKIMDIPLGEGDTRPLVRHLRMLAYYVSAVLLVGANGKTNGNRRSTHPVSVVQEEEACYVTVSDYPTLGLRLGTMDNIFPVKHQIFDPRTQQVMDKLQPKLVLSENSFPELSTILDFWLGGALAPAVILCTRATIADTLIATVQEALTNSGVKCIGNIDVSTYKMMKSLYDPRDTPNLRDDILKLGGGKRTGISGSTLVAMELQCPTIDEQLCIREMLEDTPSMTAFSSDRSALYKSGLLFAVYIQGDVITPELQSRASLIL